MANTFALALRGYDMSPVDHILGRAKLALASSDGRHRQSMLNELRSAEFPQRLRGYDRATVDRAVEDLVRRPADRSGRTAAARCRRLQGTAAALL